MSEYMFKKMPYYLENAYKDVAKSKKRTADAKTLKALADALKEHGSPEQYAACQTAIVAFWEKTLEDLRINVDSSQIDPDVKS